MLSPPSRRRGLKLIIVLELLMTKLVASLAEAWIEINGMMKHYFGNNVASLAEAWIEIYQVFRIIDSVNRSPPSRRRGLKYYPMQSRWGT